MTIDEIREKKRILGYSNETLSRISGVPLGTVQKVLAGVTKAPRQKTLEALSRALNNSLPGRDKVSYPRLNPDIPGSFVRETAPAYPVEQHEYTIDDIRALPEGIRAELVDGKIYYMACPTWTHQKIIGKMYQTVANYIDAKGGPCEVCLSPFAVYLNADDSIYLEPDLSVICDKNKLDDSGCHGAPDWIVEVVSPGSRKMDTSVKLFKYRDAGVREYWMIYPERRLVMVHIFQKDSEDAALYSFEDKIPSFLYPDLKIRLADMV